MPNLAYLWIISLFFVLIALTLLSFSLKAFRNKKVWGGISRVGFSFVFLVLATLLSLLNLATWGYKALTFEQYVATISATELAEQRYQINMRFADGSSERFDIAGDQLYIDAKIIKWHPYASLLGFRTLFELDRVTGRYVSLDDEQTQARTVYSLEANRNLDLFDAEQVFKPLGLIIDADYGSASFQLLENNQSYELSVSTTGLILREIN